MIPICGNIRRKNGAQSLKGLKTFFIIVGKRWRVESLYLSSVRNSSTAWKVPRYGVISGSNTEKYGPEITPHLQTFHAVIINAVLGLSRNIPLLKLLHYLHWLLV